MALESPLQIMRSAFGKAFIMPDDDKLIVDCLAAIMTSAIHKELTESVWIYVIAPPGSGKTLSVSPLHGHSRVMMLSTPTENCLMSGYRDDDGNDPSLVLLLDGKVLIWKDFTALMDAGERLVAKISGEFRDVFDHYCSKASGRSGVTEYHAKFGMVACVTDRIDAFAEKHQQLGERFLSFRMNRIQTSHAQRVAALKDVVKAMKGKQEWTSKLQQTVHQQLDRIILKCEKVRVPTLSAGAEEQVIVMADLLALARTSSSGTASRAEIASRIVQQFINLGHAHAIADFREAWNESELVLLRRIMLDSLSLARRRLFSFMYSLGRHRPAVTKQQLINKCGCTEGEIVNILNQYRFSHVLQPVEGGSPDDVWYKLAPDIYESIYRTGVLV